VIARRRILLLACAGAVAACAAISGVSDLVVDPEQADAAQPADARVDDTPSIDDGLRPSMEAGPDVLPDGRVTNGLVALYAFTETGGKVAHDTSGVPPPLDLTISSANGNQGPTFGKDGLTIKAATILTSGAPAQKIIDACAKSEEVTIEAWVTAAIDSQFGRIGGVGANNGDVDFTIAAENHTYAAVLRTDAAASPFSQLFTPDGSVTTAQSHVVAVRNVTGERIVYLDAAEIARDTPSTDLSIWSKTLPFTIANAASMDLAWLGTLHLVAMYCRALTPAEIARNFAAGPR
jgi:hypothetical protein